jgi:hypothetical protein
MAAVVITPHIHIILYFLGEDGFTMLVHCGIQNMVIAIF